MKTNYFFKHALLLVALFGFSGIFAQTAKTPNFVEIDRPVVATNGMDSLSFSFESGAAWGDYNNDGLLDLITGGVSNNWAKITMFYKNNGNGTFTKVTHPFPNLDAANITWFDYNNDGNLDLFLAGQDDLGKYSTLYKNRGAAGNYEFEEVFQGTFEYVNNGGGNRANRYVIAGDVNNDGWVDIYLQGENESGRHAFLYKNLKGQGFEKVENPVNGTQTFVQLNAGSAAFGDYDGDGYLDLIASGYAADSPIYPNGYVAARYKNNGDGTFAAPVFFDGTESGELAWCDYNNDGKLDYVVTGVGANSFGWYWKTDIYENSGAGSFTLVPAAQNGMPNNKQAQSIAWGDVNNDGYSDLLYMNAGPSGVFLNNFGDQTFTRSNFNFAGIHNEDGSATADVWGGTACLADIDNDNDLDAFMIAYGANSKARLWKNELGDGIPVNVAPSVPTGLNAVVAEGHVTFSWTASTDDLSEKEGIKYNLYVKKAGDDHVMSLLPADLSTGRLKVNEILAPLSTTSYTINGLENGTYTVGVQAIDQSKVASHFATVQFIVGPNALGSNLENEVSIISSKNFIRINSTDNIQGNVVIYNSNGLEVYTKSGKINNNQINLPGGVYVVKVVSDSNTIVRKAIVK
ncbi:MAG: FG-GAP-like repeat-containing protein [Paludibacter sp.]